MSDQTDSQSSRPSFDTYDPAVAQAMVLSMPLTGIPEYLDIRVTDVGPGTMTAELEVRPELLNPFGSAHGGVLAALMDHVLGAVLYPLIAPGAWAATTELKLNFLAPIRDGVLEARSEVISLTRRTAVVRIAATNGDRLVGAAQGTVTISEPRRNPS
jgi:1,4-dihydroxy-2-naphthoyl-CoA hydrolase